MKSTQIKNEYYNAWLHWSPTNKCNLNCVYCFTKPFERIGEISNINISGFLKTLNETTI